MSFGFHSSFVIRISSVVAPPALHSEMAPPFQTGRKSALLSRRLKRHRSRRLVVSLILTAVILPGLLYLLKLYLEKSWEFTNGELQTEVVSFDPQLVYSKALALMEEGKANEFKGNKQIVIDRFNEALSLLELIAERAPDYKSESVSRDREFLLNKLRKAK